MRRIALVFAGGFCGTLARYFLSAPLLLVAASSLPGARASFPFDILAINLSGAFALGLLYGLVERGGRVSQDVRLFLGTGFLGAYTTFSSLAYGGDRLVASGAGALAVAYWVGSIALGIATARLGVSSAGLLIVQRRLVRRGLQRVRRLPGRAAPAFLRLGPSAPPAHHHNELLSHASGRHRTPQVARGPQDRAAASVRATTERRHTP